MGKMKCFFRRTSVKTSFATYIIICLFTAILLSLASSSLCQFGQQQISLKYQEEYHKTGSSGQVVLENGDKVGGTLVFFTRDMRELFSDADRRIYTVLGILNLALIPVWFALSIGIASMLFYRRILQKPLEILDNAAENIADSNLDFTISYDRQDEMGRLCLSFEKMRVALRENNFEMWRQMDERKRLNAAFSHDLRTPLTVLKGQSEMLLKYVPDGKMGTEKIVAVAETMRAHVDRLENYVSTMNSLQRLEDIDIEKTRVDKDEIIAEITEIGKAICAGKEIQFDTKELSELPLKVDLPVVLQVYENILANAVRFTKCRITVKLSETPSFAITISDDGPGFTQKDLAEAAKPFYKSDNRQQGQQDELHHGQHFGMGLNICKILCEKHGGCLQLSNQDGGATVKAVF